MAKARACVVGSTGFAGVELVRLLLAHPEIELTMACDRKHAGETLASCYRPSAAPRSSRSLRSTPTP